jgi:Tol biopolymer transport system component
LAFSRSGRARGTPVRLTTGLGATAVSLAANGQRLAYSVYRAQANIWSLPVPDGPPITAESARALTGGQQVVESMRLSPDGRWLVFDSDLRGNPDIFRMELPGGQPEQLTNDPAHEFAPSLSPDGRFVAYHSFRSGTRDIEIKPLDGGPIEPVTNSPRQESYPQWLPDGQAILFLDQVVPWGAYLVRREAEGGWSRQPALIVPRVSLPAASPDGRTIAYIEGGQQYAIAGPIAVVPIAGGEPRRLFEPGPGVGPPAVSVQWGADGRTLYFKSFDPLGRASFWSVSAQGGMPGLLVTFADLDRPSSRADFATDGRHFYFTIVDRQSDVFVAEVIPQ